MERKTIRRRILFYGRVQGVGFRYRARYAAESLCLTGWVYNEEDGTGTMEVQGDEASIDRLLQMLQQDRYIDIVDMDIKNLIPQENERNFEVKESRQRKRGFHCESGSPLCLCRMNKGVDIKHNPEPS